MDTQGRCCICNESFRYPVDVKWVGEKKAYAHKSCAGGKRGWWAAFKALFGGGPRW